MASLVTEAGAAVTGFSARQVSQGLLRDADLVLTLTRDHRARVVEMAPAIVRCTFTLLEFARILSQLDLGHIPAGLSAGERLRTITPPAAGMRPMVRRGAQDTDDVPDPYRREPEDYRLAMEMIRRATDTIITAANG